MAYGTVTSCLVDQQGCVFGSTRKALPRPVVIDACNVARGHSVGRKKVSCAGILVCLRWFLDRGHRVETFIPITYRNHPEVTCPEVLDALRDLGLLGFTSARRIKDEPRPSNIRFNKNPPPGLDLKDLWGIANYDDMYMIQRAHDIGGVVISNDNFVDLAVNRPEWHDTIYSRTLKVRWDRRKSPLFVDNFVLYNLDPAQVLYCTEESLDYDVVAKNQLEPSAKTRLICAVEDLIEKCGQIIARSLERGHVERCRNDPQFTPGSSRAGAPYRRETVIRGWKMLDDPRDFLVGLEPEAMEPNEETMQLEAQFFCPKQLPDAPEGAETNNNQISVSNECSSIPAASDPEPFEHSATPNNQTTGPPETETFNMSQNDERTSRSIQNVNGSYRGRANVVGSTGTSNSQFDTRGRYPNCENWATCCLAELDRLWLSPEAIH